MTLCLEEALLVREAAERLLAGETLTGVAHDWNARGVKTVTGRVWTPNVLRGVLSSARVAGLRSHRGEVVGKAAWPGILRQEEWERLNRIFASRIRRRADSTNRRLLTGLL